MIWIRCRFVSPCGSTETLYFLCFEFIKSLFLLLFRVVLHSAHASFGTRVAKERSISFPDINVNLSWSINIRSHDIYILYFSMFLSVEPEVEHEDTFWLAA